MRGCQQQLTDVVFGCVVLAGELITVTEQQFPAPNIDHCTKRKVTVMVIVSLYSTSLSVHVCVCVCVCVCVFESLPQQLPVEKGGRERVHCTLSQ